MPGGEMSAVLCSSAVSTGEESFQLFQLPILLVFFSSLSVFSI